MRASTILVSLVAHAGVYLVLSRCTLDLDERAIDTASSAPRLELVQPAEPTPVEIVVLDEPAVPPVTAADPTASPAMRAVIGRVAAAAGRTPAASIEATIEPAPGSGQPSPTGMLAMRGRRHDLVLPGAAAERIISGGTPVATEATEEPRWAHDPKIKLVPSGGGTTEIRDRVAKVHIAPDGTISTMESAPDFTFKLNLPTPSGIKKQFERAVRELEDWRKDPYRDTRVGTMQDLPRHLQAAPDACQRWNDPMCRTAEDWQEQFKQEDEEVASGALVAGTADISGWLQRKFVGDPYASRKRKLLDQTRDERVRIGTEYRGEQLDRSMELIQRNLVTLWRTVADPTERRAALFAMWDECAEGEGPAGAAGERARMMVIGWIRSKLPEDEPGAFSADELARLNAKRTSRKQFAPY